MKYLLFLLHLGILSIAYSTYFNRYINPDVFPYFGLSALALPAVFLVNVFFLFLWLFFKKRYFVFFLFLNIGLIPVLNKTYHFYGNEKSENSNLKVLSYNIHNYREGKDSKLYQFFEKENPDVICLQETYKKQRDFIPKGYHFLKHGRVVAIASKHLIINQYVIKSPKIGSMESAYFDIVKGEDTLRIFSVHLRTMRIDKKLVKKTIETENVEGNTQKILGKLTNGFKYHQKELTVIKKHIEKSPYPVIVCGDFNAVPESYEYSQMKALLNDSFELGGSGLGTTFHEFKFPIRIDYIWTSQGIGVKSCEVKREPFSDHFPVIAELKIPH